MTAELRTNEVPGVSPLTELQGSESSDAGLADEEEKEGQVTTGCPRGAGCFAK